MRRVAGVTLACLLAGSVGLAAVPASGTDAETQLSETQAQLEALEAQLEADQEHAASLEDHLVDVNVMIDRNEDVSLSLDRALAEQRKRLARTQAEHEALRVRFDAMLRNVYIGGGSNFVNAIVGATSAANLSERVDVMMTVAEGNLSLAEQMETSADAMRTEAGETSQLAAQQERVVAEVHQARIDTIAESEEVEEAMRRIAATKIELAQLASRLKARLGIGGLAALQNTLQGANSVTYGQWAKVVAGELGASSCKENMIVLIAWQGSEGTDAAWNPLATTYTMPGATDFNSIGVKNYTSLGQGLDATRLTLKRGWDQYGYGDIVTGLRHCDDAEDTAAAIAASMWCGCGSGYVVGLVDDVRRDYDYWSKL